MKFQKTKIITICILLIIFMSVNIVLLSAYSQYENSFSENDNTKDIISDSFIDMIYVGAFLIAEAELFCNIYYWAFQKEEHCLSRALFHTLSLLTILALIIELFPPHPHAGGGTLLLYPSFRLLYFICKDRF